MWLIGDVAFATEAIRGRPLVAASRLDRIGRLRCLEFLAGVRKVRVERIAGLMPQSRHCPPTAWGREDSLDRVAM